MEREIHVADGSAIVAHGLQRLRRPATDARSRDPVVAWARTLTALEAYEDVDFALELVGRPTQRSGAGRLQVTVFAAERSGDAARAARIGADLGDLLRVHSDLYEFAPLSAESLRQRLELVAPTWVAEIQRRSERVRRRRPVGFGAEHDGDDFVEARALWGFPHAQQVDTREDLAQSLLAQRAPVSLRFLLSPTHLDEQETADLERQAAALNAAATPFATAAARALASLLEVRPAYEVQVLIASDQPLSPALVSSVGFAISPPRRPADRVDVLTGGYQAVHDSPEDGSLTQAFRTLRPGNGSDGDRLRRLTDPWEAAAASRPPNADDGTFPGLDVTVPALGAQAPPVPTAGVRLGETPEGETVAIPHDDRLRHTYVLGQTGTGKSTLLLRMIADDLEGDRGLAVVDPHGDLVEAALAVVPERRWDEVVLIEPTDPQAVVGLNLLEADDELQREYLVSDLCAWMYALYDTNNIGIVGPRFEQMLRYAALLLLDDEEPWSLMEIPRLFADPAFAKPLAKRATDPLVREFWHGDMPRVQQSSDYGEMAAWFRSKFEPFRSVRPLRRVLGQRSSSVHLRDTMDHGGIVLANLSKGLLGEYNARLLGFVVFARLWAATLTRATRPDAPRHPFFAYLDEAQTITTSSLPTILSEARKYGVGTTLANQFFDQIPVALRESVLGNVGTTVSFRTGARDAHAFASHYGPEVESETLRRLPNYEAVAEVLAGGQPDDAQHLHTTPVPLPPDAADRRAALRARARSNWARPVDEVDAEFASRYQRQQSRWSPSDPPSEDTVTDGFVDQWLARQRKTLSQAADHDVDARRDDAGDHQTDVSDHGSSDSSTENDQ